MCCKHRRACLGIPTIKSLRASFRSFLHCSELLPSRVTAGGSTGGTGSLERGSSACISSSVLEADGPSSFDSAASSDGSAPDDGSAKSAGSGGK